jgi:hypothetical protein
LALIIFAVLLVCGAIAACLFTPAPYTFLPAAAALPAVGMTKTASQIKDYDNPTQLQEFKTQAAGMTFQEIYDEFGINNTLANYLLTPTELKEKFDAQVREMDFSSVLRAYSLSDLSAVASPEHVALLTRLRKEEVRVRAEYDATPHTTRTRGKFHRDMNALEAQYNRFKNQP